MINVNRRYLLSALTVAMLLVAPACKQTGEDKEVNEMSQKAAELEKLTRRPPSRVPSRPAS